MASSRYLRLHRTVLPTWPTQPFVEVFMGIEKQAYLASNDIIMMRLKLLCIHLHQHSVILMVLVVYSAALQLALLAWWPGDGAINLYGPFDTNRCETQCNPLILIEMTGNSTR